MKVAVQFTYEPDEPDSDDSTGMSEAEYDQLVESLMELGATDIEINRKP